MVTLKLTLDQLGDRASARAEVTGDEDAVADFIDILFKTKSGELLLHALARQAVDDVATVAACPEGDDCPDADKHP